MYRSLLPTQSTTVISRQLSNIPTHRHGLLSKCKNNLILPTDESKSLKKTIKALSWNYIVVFPEQTPLLFLTARISHMKRSKKYTHSNKFIN